jgi:SurA-like N-terminal domain
LHRVAGSIAAVVALVIAGGLAERSFALPAAEELAPNTVARVSDVPVRKGTITTAEFRHALLLTAVSAGRRSTPKPGGNGYERLKKNAIGALLETAWVRGEAVEMDIVVTHHQVSRELAQIKRESFESEAEYHRFLRASHYTRRDVYERVELQLLSLRMQKRLQTRIERESRNKYEEQQAFQEFVTEFTERWRARTVCAPEYATDRCSNGPPPS